MTASDHPPPAATGGGGGGFTADDVHDLVAHGDRVLLLFTARWCAATAPLRKQLAATSLPCPLIEVDVDTHPQLADRYVAVSLPTIVLVDASVEQSRLTGAFGPQRVKDLANRPRPGS